MIDAGAANDLPLTPLFRPGRRVDVIIGFDISSDASDKISRSILDPKEDITKRRGIKSVARDKYCLIYDYTPNGKEDEYAPPANTLLFTLYK